MENTKNITIKKLKSLLADLNMEFHISESSKRPEWHYQLELPRLKKLFFLYAEKALYPRTVQEKAALANAQGVEVILLTESVSQNTFNLCRDLGVNIVSTGGNTYLKSTPLYVDMYHDVRQKPQGTSKTVFTPKSSRIVRAMLCNPRKSWSQKELIQTLSVSQSLVSKVLNRLENQGYVSYGNSAELLDPARLLEDWAVHYRFDRHKKRSFAFSFSEYEKGLQLLDSRFRDRKLNYAFTGWSGSYLRAAYSTSEKYMAYISDPDCDGIDGLHELESGGNVMLYTPQDEGVFQFCQTVNGLPVVSDVQVYLDLFRMPGRSSEQTEHLRNKLLTFGE